MRIKIKYTKYYVGISVIALVISIGAMLIRGFNYGIDFSGGHLFQVKYEPSAEVTLNKVNNTLDTLRDEIRQMDPNSRKVQTSDDGVVIIRTQEVTEDETTRILEVLGDIGGYKLEKIDQVGASVGAELKSSAIYSLVIGGILIGLYITFRFEFTFALGAIMALLHDVIISAGIIALLGYEINSTFIAAILTILGYSINDTIVVYDRIRENLKIRRRNKKTIEETLDESLNQVITRSINTSVTTLFSIIALLIFGGDTLKTFVVTLLVGVTAGTYSSLFVATPLVYLMTKSKKTLESFDDEKDKKEDQEKILV